MRIHFLPPHLFVFFLLFSTYVFCKTVLASDLLEGHSGLSSDEGYTHLFGQDNLAVDEDGKAARISLDKNSGLSGLSFDEGYTHLFGQDNLAVDEDGKAARISLDKNSGLSGLSFDEGYTHLFGQDNLAVDEDGKAARISLDKNSGSGFVSHDLYQYGLFSASIKLPADYTAGVVVAFYMSNGDMFEENHDEIDFEFLGNIRGRDWRVQTNVYGNGSTSTGREERYNLWFDPSQESHRYTILWTKNYIVFYVDEVPIREVKRTKSMASHYPAKPMSLYATIWDGSDWATAGGRYKVNYKLAPFVAQFTHLILHGCAVDPIEVQSTTCGLPLPELPVDTAAMGTFRENHVTYSYCYDRLRYSSPLPECILEPEVAGRLGKAGSAKFGRHGGHGRSRLPNYHHQQQLV